MSSHARVHHTAAAIVMASLLLLAACNNTYGPPANGKPENWGQQHYLDVQKYREQNENRMND
jgi:hypothetical protein